MPDDLLDSLERAAQVREAPAETVAGDPVDAVLNQIHREASDLKPIRLPWPRLSRASRLLRPGGLSVVGGAPGAGKSFFALALGLACDAAGERWAYLPLESDRAFFLRRMAAMLARSFDPLLTEEDDPDAARKAAAAVERVRPKLRNLASCIYQNPAMPDASGAVQTVTPGRVLEWIESQFNRGCRVCIFDPLACVDFGAVNHQWQAESRFVNDLIGLAMRHEKCVCMVAHTTKRWADSRKVDVGDLQGGAAISRLASAVILLQADNPAKTAHVFRQGGFTAQVQHNRTATVGKSRNNEGGAPIALDFGHDGPLYRELGVIASKDKICPAPGAVDEWSPYKG
jgi:hypothetical protein